MSCMNTERERERADNLVFIGVWPIWCFVVKFGRWFLLVSCVNTQRERERERI